MISVVWSMALVALVFCSLVFVHELGHYIAAKICGLYVPRFSIGFGPVLWKKKLGETEFCIALLPLGGYVSLPQVSGDLEQIEGKFEIPRNLKAAPCAARVIVAIMGPAANMALALALSFVLWHRGLPVDSSELSRTVGYVEETLALGNGEVVPSPADIAGMKVGDEIISIDGIPVGNFGDIQRLIALGGGRDMLGRARTVVKVARGNKFVDLELRPVLVGKSGSCNEFREIGILPKQELIIENVPRDTCNIAVGDEILRANGRDIFHIRSLHEVVSNCRIVKLEVLRGDQPISTVLATRLVTIEKPYAVLQLENVVADIIPFFPADVDKSLPLESTDAQLKLFSTQSNDLQKHELFSGAEIVRVNGNDCRNLCDVVRLLSRHHKNIMTILKSGMDVDIIIPAVQIRLVPAVCTNVLGLGLKTNSVVLHRPPLEQIRETISVTLRTLGCLFDKNSDVSVKNLMGPAGLARTLHMFLKKDARLLLWFVILVNVNLAIINMLPLPVLDGGHIAIAILEKLTGGKCVAKIFGALQSIFLLILLGLLAYVSFFDIRRWIADRRSDSEHSRQMRLRM
ncbi:MAG: site-2 protease family protein [Puniceicoccales bacterium]|nr:site-2 protease family protein [Puniceicoccales bacterium]